MPLLCGRQEKRQSLLSLAEKAAQASARQNSRGPSTRFELSHGQPIEQALFNIESNIWKGVEGDVVGAIGNIYLEDVQNNLLKPNAKNRLFFSLTLNAFWPHSPYQKLAYEINRHDINHKATPFSKTAFWGCDSCLTRLKERSQQDTVDRDWLTNELNCYPTFTAAKNGLIFSFGDVNNGPAYILLVDSQPSIDHFMFATSQHNTWCQCIYLPPNWKHVSLHQPLRLSILSNDKVCQMVRASIPYCKGEILPFAHFCELALIILNSAIQKFRLEGQTYASFVNNYIRSEVDVWTKAFRSYGPHLPREAQQKLHALYTLSDSPTTIDIKEIPTHLQAPFASLVLSVSSYMNYYRLKDNKQTRPFIFRTIIKQTSQQGTEGCKVEESYAANPVLLLSANLEFDEQAHRNISDFVNRDAYRSFEFDDSDFVPKYNKTVTNVIEALRSLSYLELSSTILSTHLLKNSTVLKKAADKADQQIQKWCRDLLSSPELPGTVKGVLTKLTSDGRRRIIDLIIPIFVKGPDGNRALILLPRSKYFGVPPGKILVDSYTPIQFTLHHNVLLSGLLPLYSDLPLIVWLPKKEPRALVYTRRHRALGKNNSQLLERLLGSEDAPEQMSTAGLKKNWSKLWSIAKPLSSFRLPALYYR